MAVLLKQGDWVRSEWNGWSIEGEIESIDPDGRVTVLIPGPACLRVHAHKDKVFGATRPQTGRGSK